MSAPSPLIVTNEEHRFLALEQLREIGVEAGAALLEPVARNTASALTLAALAAVERGEDPMLVVPPADQTVADAGAFNGPMHHAIRQVAEGAIVILGVTLDRPETGYGYIQVKPGASLSLQKRNHHAEHWVVVKGMAEITCGDTKRLLTENQSTYIPRGEVHCLVNPCIIPQEIIEVQSGSQLGEDDIVHFEGHYGRSQI